MLLNPDQTHAAKFSRLGAAMMLRAASQRAAVSDPSSRCERGKRCAQEPAVAAAAATGTGAMAPGPFRLACGLGIGVAHLWTLEQGGIAKYEGRVKAKGSTIVAMALSTGGGTLITATRSSNKALVWDLACLQQAAAARGCGSTFDGKPGSDAKAVAISAVALGDFMGHRAAAQFIAEHGRSQAGLQQAGSVRDFVLRAAQEEEGGGARWGGLFPVRLLDQDAYDGETNERGVPHGIGEQLQATRTPAFKHTQHTHTRHSGSHWRGSLTMLAQPA